MQRRQFLKSLVVAVGALAATPSIPQQEPEPSVWDDIIKDPAFSDWWNPAEKMVLCQMKTRIGS